MSAEYSEARRRGPISNVALPRESGTQPIGYKFSQSIHTECHGKTQQNKSLAGRRSSRVCRRALESLGWFPCFGVQWRSYHWKTFHNGCSWLAATSRGAAHDNLFSTSCRRYRLSSHAVLFAFLPLHLNAWTLPADIQRRIFCPAPKTICLERLGGCRST
jgi:hypothetical protein